MKHLHMDCPRAIQSKNLVVLSTDGSSALAPRYTSEYEENSEMRFRVIAGGHHAYDETSQLEERTRNRKIFTVIMVGMALVCSVWVFTFLHGQSAYAQSIAHLEEHSIVVAPGDTLTGLSQRYSIPGITSSDTAKWISQRNDLATVSLQVGQHIIVPQTQ